MGGEPFPGAGEQCWRVQRREHASLKPPVLVHLWFHCQPGQRVHGHPAHPQCRSQPGCRAAPWVPALDTLLSGKVSRIRHCVVSKVHLETPIFGLKKKVFSLPEFQDHSENCEWNSHSWPTWAPALLEAIAIHARRGARLFGQPSYWCIQTLDTSILPLLRLTGFH